MLDRPHKSVWEAYPELADRLKVMWTSGLSASQIRDELANDRIYVTRNAVVGKLARLGMLRADSPKVTRKPKVNAGGVASRLAHSLLVKPSAPLPKPPPAYVGFLGIALDDLKTDMCRYPRGDNPPFLFCGQPVQEGSSFCPHCHARCWRPREPRVRRRW